MRGEDLLQAALTKTFLAWRRVRAADEPTAYVRRIMVNTHTSSGRRRRVREHLTPAVEQMQDASAGPADVEVDALMAALARLGRRQRAVVLLRYQQEWPDEDIARALHCSTATVRSQASRALAKLRDVPELAAHRQPATRSEEKR